MKALFFLPCMLGVTISEGQQVISNEVKEVTVFLNGAQVLREVKLKLVPGAQDIRIKELANQIDANSIQIRSSSDFIIQAVRHELNYIQPNQNKAEELLKKKGLVKDELAKQEQVLFLLQFEKTSLQKNQVQLVGVPNSNAKLEDLKLLVEYQKSKLAEILPKIYELEKKTKELQVDIDKIDRQIAEINQGEKEPSSELVLSLISKTASTVELDLIYYTQRASWTMNYDVRVKDLVSPIELFYKAQVNQQTGEDWKNVKLSLATANPLMRGDRPVLFPWFLRNQSPPVAYDSYQRGAPPAAMELKAQAAGAEVYVSEKEQVTSRMYNIDLPYTILSNNKPFQVEIKRVSVPARYIYYAIPKLDADAFLTAEISDWEDLNLIDGEAQLFFEGSFQGKVFINTQSIQDIFRLSLGRDKNIVIERNKIKDYSKNKFLSDKVELTKGYEFIIKNKKSQAIELIVEDQLPLSTAKEIKVEVDELSGASSNNETGELRWVYNLKPSEQQKFRFRYKVTYPKDFVLNLE